MTGTAGTTGPSTGAIMVMRRFGMKRRRRFMMRRWWFKKAVQYITQ
jgi:phage I-like protein